MFTEIKDAVSTKEAASFYGLRVGRSGMCVCPFHNDKNPSMKVDKRFHCFGCGADGDVINFVQKLYGMDAKEAALKLISDFSLNIETDYRETARERNARLKRAKQAEYEKSVRAAYAEELYRFRTKLTDIHRTLHRWSLDYEPTRKGWDADRVDERYATAICYREQLESLLDTVEFGNDSEVYNEFKKREDTLAYYGKRITEAERRAAERTGRGAHATDSIKRITGDVR